MSSMETKRTLPNSSSSSGSDLEQRERKRLRRKESNRESARRSRERKQRRLENLVGEVARLKAENDQYGRRIGELTQSFIAADSQNAVLRVEKERLAGGLESLQAVLGENEDGRMSKDEMMGMKMPWPLQQKQLPLYCGNSSPLRLIASSGYEGGNDIVRH